MSELKLASYNIFLLIIIILFFSSPDYAQENGNFSVKWVDEFKSTKNWDDESGIVTKIFNLITGEDYVELNRPVNITVNSNKYLILDQGRRSIHIVDFENKESKIFIENDDDTFPSLIGICFTKDGNVFVTDSQNGQITKIDSDYEDLRNFAANLDLNKPTGIAYCEKSKKIRQKQPQK